VYSIILSTNNTASNKHFTYPSVLILSIFSDEILKANIFSCISKFFLSRLLVLIIVVVNCPALIANFSFIFPIYILVQIIIPGKLSCDLLRYSYRYNLLILN